ncbi:MAG: hypothetical protein SGPRY_000429 [Prymnesium sp.]
MPPPTAAPRARSRKRRPRELGGALKPREVSAQEFFRLHLSTNTPALLHGLTHHWEAMRAWSSPDGTPNLDHFLRSPMVDSVVPVDLLPRDGSGSGYGEAKRLHIPMREFARRWSEATAEPAPERPLPYLRDWHFARDFPAEAAAAYSPPPPFGLDWLNEWWATARAAQSDEPADDFRFVYIGPAGSWTSLHHDVLNSFSWSANVCGVKHWLLFPPSVTPLLKDGSGQLVPDARPQAASAARDSRWPGLPRALSSSVEIVQRAGEVVFVPSGWHHQVHNLTHTISINHNWLTGACLPSLTNFLLGELEGVRRTIAQWRGEAGCSLKDASMMEPQAWHQVKALQQFETQTHLR